VYLKSCPGLDFPAGALNTRIPLRESGKIRQYLPQPLSWRLDSYLSMQLIHGHIHIRLIGWISHMPLNCYTAVR